MIIIKGGFVASPLAVVKSDVAIEGEKIALVKPDIAPAQGDEIIDASGCIVFPGFIDAHTHLDMGTGTAHTADDFASGTLGAVCGGTTTIVDYACQSRGSTLTEALDEWKEKAEGKAYCDYGFHMSITDWNALTVSQMDEMQKAGVTSFKLYMAYDALRLNDYDILDILFHIKKMRGIMCVHCENGDMVDYLVTREKMSGRFSPASHPASRPAEVEAEAVSRLLYMSRIADHPVNVVHLSSALALSEVRKARARGQKVFVETCPQYMLLDDSLYRSEGFEGAKYVCSPPLRSKDDVAAIVEAVSAGEIDTISTDHCGFYFNGQKTLGKDDFSAIPNGLPGIEFRPGLIYGQFVKTDALSLQAMCALLSERPAKLYGMYPQKGAILPGSDADLVVWRDGDDKIDFTKQHMKCDYSPFEGIQTGGTADTVLLRGNVVVHKGEPVCDAKGRYVPRGLPMIEKM